MPGRIRHGADRDVAAHHPQPGAGRAPAGRAILTAAVAAVILSAACLAGTAGRAEPVTSRDVYVLDGHTVDRNGQPIVLEGFDVPDFDHPQCPGERALAARTAARLRQIVGRAGSLDLEMVACACPEGTEGTPECNKGARCGRLTVDGRDVGAVLVSENLARAFACGPHSCPKRQSWCQ